jgi:excisionase family DNA binding protein
MNEEMFSYYQLTENCVFKLDKVLINQEQILMNQAKILAEINIVQNRLDHISSMLFYGKKILTVDEAATYIGMTKSHFYKIARKYLIKGTRPTGGKKFYYRTELDEFLSTTATSVEVNKYQEFYNNHIKGQ